MSSNLEDYLKEVDKWKFKLHRKLKKMTEEQRAAFWKKSHEKSRARGLRVVDLEETPPASPKRRRVTG